MKTIPVLYRLEPHDPAGHRFKITLTLAEPDPAGQTLSLPTWIPGSYLVRDFSRQIETLTARLAGARAPISKSDNHTWVVAPGAGPLIVEYVVYAWDLSVRGAHLDESHAFFNGTSVFLCAAGHENLPCVVDIVPPRGIAGWKVYTSLPEAHGLPGAARRWGFGRYIAPDYDALIDHPVEMGTAQTVRFTVCGAEHELVFTGLAPQLDLERLARDVGRICEAQIAFFEPRTRRAPFLDSADRYVFMTTVTRNGYGGLEHRSSTALMAARKDLPAVGEPLDNEGYRTFLGLVSHEYFHTWNVKRIKPTAFAPYDLRQPKLTRLLWLFEGFTSYYDDLFLLRAGIITQNEYLRLLAKTITSVTRAPGRHKQSVVQSSFDAWTRYYKQDENSPNALVSYYTKGSLVALGLDLTIRTQSGSHRSLDDVMRLMWTRHGRRFYAGKPVGIEENSVAALVLEATGVNVSRFLARYAEGTADVPLADLLASQGVQTEWKNDSPQPTLDIVTLKQNGELIVATAYEGGAAHRGGVSAGDTLVAIDGVRVDAQSGLEPLLRRYRPGAVVPVHVFRRDELRVYRVRLAQPAPDQCHLSRSL